MPPTGRYLLDEPSGAATRAYRRWRSRTKACSAKAGCIMPPGAPYEVHLCQRPGCVDSGAPSLRFEAVTAGSAVAAGRPLAGRTGIANSVIGPEIPVRLAGRTRFLIASVRQSHFYKDQTAIFTIAIEHRDALGKSRGTRPRRFPTTTRPSTAGTPCRNPWNLL
jgi:hypothetical protein